MNDLILHPEYEALYGEISKLKEEIVVLRTSLDRANMVEAELLKVEYNKRFGRLELELAQKYYQFRLLKRRLELIRSYLNRGEEPDMKVIDTVIETEAEEYNEILRRKARAAERASQTEFREYTDEEAAHAKKLYQGLVRALHPDLHPDATPSDIARLQQAVEAYASGDLATLEAIAVLVEGDVKKEQLPSGLDSLRARASQYRKTLESLASRLCELRGKFPFTESALLSDPQKIAERVEMLKGECATLDNRIAACERQLEQMNGTV